MSHSENIVRIRAVHNALMELQKQVVFVGGATTSLYADRIVSYVRPTKDVDVVIEMLSMVDEARIEDKLRRIGFVNDPELRGRFIYEETTIVDIMPVSGGFSGEINKWYPEGFKHAIDYEIDEQGEVKIFTAPHFIASKLEAFKSRGNNDGRTSTDFEDIVSLMENRTVLFDELSNADEDVREYIREEFSTLMKIPYFHEWISSNVNSVEDGMTEHILNKLEQFIRKS